MKTYDVTIRFTVVDIGAATGATLELVRRVHEIADAVVKDIASSPRVAVTEPEVEVVPQARPA